MTWAIRTFRILTVLGIMWGGSEVLMLGLLGHPSVEVQFAGNLFIFALIGVIYYISQVFDFIERKMVVKSTKQLT
ncbi:MAG TPA: hypothetical protein VFM18_17055 [Methanosarcina sp.]|nr:hypothetical protein [Methanosarcina sp.]